MSGRVLVSSVNSRSYGTPVGRLLDAAAGAVAATGRGAVEASERSRPTHGRDEPMDRHGEKPEHTEPQDADFGSEPPRRSSPVAGAERHCCGTCDMQARPYSVEFDPTKGVSAARFEEVASHRARRAYEAGKRVGGGDRDPSSGSLLDRPS